MKAKTILVIVAIVVVGVFFVGYAIGHRHAAIGGATAGQGKTLYSCGMHPWIIQDHPGNCPICGMKLEPVHKPASDFSGSTVPGAPAGKGKILYYKSTMIPGETRPKPGKDSMGMDMVPVYENEAAAASSSVIALDPATIQLMNIQTTEITRGPLRRTIRTVGTIDYNETALADVTTKFKGWVEKLDVDATGQLVHQGEPLFEIYSPELYSAQAEYLSVLDGGGDAASPSREKQTASPGSSVETSGAAPPAPSETGASQPQLRDAALTKLKFFDVPDSEIAELQKNRAPLRTLKVVAPEDGFVVEKNVVQGQMVEAGARLYRLADLGIVWVFAQVYEQDLPYVQLGEEATVKLSSLPDRQFRGRVTYVYPNVDEKTRTARVRLEFENPGYFLKPGMFVSAEITSELEPSALLVPDSAVLRSGEKNTVFVALPGGRFDPRTVALGPEGENSMVAVISGLSREERVVTSSQFMLDSESQLNEAIQKMAGRNVESLNRKPVESENRPTIQRINESTNPVYVCPMPEHVSIVYDHPGKCPICGMALVPVTPGELNYLQPGGKVLYYTCPMPEHSYVHEAKPGKCPVCGMTLIPVMASPNGIQQSHHPPIQIPIPNPASLNTNSPPFKQSAARQLYTCPMHPEVVSNQPGKCPKCGMDLVPMDDDAK